MAVEPACAGNSDVLVDVRNLSLSIPVRFSAATETSAQNSIGLLKSVVAGGAQRIYQPILRNISFSLTHGDKLGVVGVNGAGKSTLLRVLAGIYKPTSGTVRVSGKVGTLFDINLGFHQEGTGYENIYLRGLLMGLTVAEVKQKIAGIAEFTELGAHLGKPYKTYSQGMRLRLAVAVSTLMEPDVLIVDEWIGSGDKVFRAKVTERLNSLIGKSKVLIVASHNESLVNSLCNKILTLQPIMGDDSASNMVSLTDVKKPAPPAKEGKQASGTASAS